MAKQSMVQREKKRERLVSKYRVRRKLLKEKFKKTELFNERVILYRNLKKYQEILLLPAKEIVVG